MFYYIEKIQSQKVEYYYQCNTCKITEDGLICILQAKMNHSSHDLVYCGRSDSQCECGFDNFLFKKLTAWKMKSEEPNKKKDENIVCTNVKTKVTYFKRIAYSKCHFLVN